MGDQKTEVYFVFMNFDPKYERLHADRWVELSKEGVEELDTYLSKKHDRLLEKLFQPNTYKKKSSLAIVDGFSVEITKEQAATLRSAKEVRVVEKNQELA
ncbi:uncharacterized protein LOC135678790 isoform X1 [Musa acuminata AAA Group]|uniref:(wild Malaysian banana) hypothetical protein n=1 Tax=Musa acuminata subsp. malaccensis TaxID=214687 RepID=A0A804JVL5_MUSAM|nr:PREDICTED: uncharacterized protein LOC103991638 isoform X1 [Musa acuminata subsp. malaccensis]CAG1856548.1 unnamed protein product [Musa acuminata subsp. malaccensis]